MLVISRRFFVVDDDERTVTYFTSETCEQQKGQFGIVEVQQVEVR